MEKNPDSSTIHFDVVIRLTVEVVDPIALAVKGTVLAEDQLGEPVAVGGADEDLVVSVLTRAVTDLMLQEDAGFRVHRMESQPAPVGENGEAMAIVWQDTTSD